MCVPGNDEEEIGVLKGGIYVSKRREKSYGVLKDRRGGEV